LTPPGSNFNLAIDRSTPLGVIAAFEVRGNASTNYNYVGLCAVVWIFIRKLEDLCLKYYFHEGFAT